MNLLLQSFGEVKFGKWIDPAKVIIISWKILFGQLCMYNSPDLPDIPAINFMNKILWIIKNVNVYFDADFNLVAAW